MVTQASPGAAAETASPPGLRHRRVRLAAGEPAAARAVAVVRAVLEEWHVPVDYSLAAVLVSDLVINAAVNGAGEDLVLSVRCTGSRFRVEVHDASVRGDSWEAAETGPDAERGLLLAAARAAESGHYRTPLGRAVFYVLACPPPGAAPGGGQAP